MSRFQHLEIADWTPEPPDEPDSGIVDQATWLARADACFARDAFSPALAFYSRALSCDRNLPSAWAGQVRCLTEMSELPEALVWADRALERFPRSAEVLAARAVAQSRAGRSGDAMASSDQAMTSPDLGPLTWAARGEVLIALSRVSAVACFRKAMETGARDPAVAAAIGRAYAVRGLHAEALPFWRTAADLDPENPTPWCWVGRCCEAIGDDADARRAFTRAMALDPRCKTARDALHALEKAPLLRRLRRAFGRTRR